MASSLTIDGSLCHMSEGARTRRIRETSSEEFEVELGFEFVCRRLLLTAGETVKIADRGANKIGLFTVEREILSG